MLDTPTDVQEIEIQGNNLWIDCISIEEDSTATRMTSKLNDVREGKWKLFLDPVYDRLVFAHESVFPSVYGMIEARQQAINLTSKATLIAQMSGLQQSLLQDLNIKHAEYCEEQAALSHYVESYEDIDMIDFVMIHGDESRCDREELFTDNHDEFQMIDNNLSSEFGPSMILKLADDTAWSIIPWRYGFANVYESIFGEVNMVTFNMKEEDCEQENYCYNEDERENDNVRS